MFAVCLYNYPRSIRRIGQLEHLVDGNVIAEAFVAVTPVFVSDFPLFIRIVHARVEALQLLRVVYVKPEFHHNSARISEGSLKFVYFIICAGPFALFCEAFKALKETRIYVPGMGSVNKLGAYVPAYVEIGVVVALIVVAILFVVLRWTKFGRSVYAVGGNGGTMPTGGVGNIIGTLFGVLSLSTIKNIVSSLGLDEAWWTNITVAAMICLFLVVQSLVLSRKNKNEN